MDKAIKLDYLAIAAHPDDIEITAGGLLIKKGEEGLKTGALDLTSGEMGTQGDPELRAKEALEAAQKMGLAYRRQLDLPDSAIEINQPSRLKIAQMIRDTAPEIVILPHWEQRHPDHRICSQLGFDACYLAGLKKAKLDGDPHRPSKILYVSYFRNLENSFLVDISDQFARKLEAVAAYKSQFGESAEDIEAIITQAKSTALETGMSPGPTNTHSVFHPGANIFEYLYVRNRHLGLAGNVLYAEAYTVKEAICIASPEDLLNRSI